MNLFKRAEPRRPLPIGRAEFEAWADRIIAGANVPGLTRRSALFSLTSMLMHLPSTESMKQDSFFAHALRKAAVNETAYGIMQELNTEIQVEKMAEKKAGLTIVSPINTITTQSDALQTPATLSGEEKGGNSL